MDEIDRSQLQQEAMLAAQISAARKQTAGLAYTGRCHNCGDVTSEERRFCDADCRADYDARRQSERRAGR